MYTELSKNSEGKCFLSICASTPIGTLETTCIFHLEISNEKYEHTLKLVTEYHNESFIVMTFEDEKGNTKHTIISLFNKQM